MLHKVVASFVLLLALSQSALAIITGINVPNQPLHPGNDFTVRFSTHKSFTNTLQYYVVFGLHKGSVPPPGTNVGETLLTSDGSDLVEGGHSISGNSPFRLKVDLPKNFHTGSKFPQKYVLTAAVFSTGGPQNAASVEVFHDTVLIAH